jgi:hypothetical protein
LWLALFFNVPYFAATEITAIFNFMRRVLLLLLSVLPLMATCQQVVYVNTDNLILRDRPEKYYMVYAILHAPCRLEVLPYDKSYKDDKAITSRFYQVGISYRQGNINCRMIGFVEKRYVVADAAKIRTAGIDTSLDISFSQPDLHAGIVFKDFQEHPDRDNALLFLPPKYKGGERFPSRAEVRTYYRGARGGCYYIGKSGKRIYVDKHLCCGD